MTIYRIRVDQGIYTYSDHSAPHPVDIRRTIIDTIPGGPCRTPVTIRTGTAVVQVVCGRRLPRQDQCPACRTLVVQVAITSHDLGTIETAL